MIARIMARLFLAPAGLCIAVNDPTAGDCRGFLLREPQTSEDVPVPEPSPGNDDQDEHGLGLELLIVAVPVGLAMWGLMTWALAS